jgi:hypothetical protein
MIITVFFLLFFLLFFLTAFFLARSNITGPLSYEGPSVVASRLRQRNRMFAGFMVVLVVILAALEVLVPDVHLLLIDLQYAVGDTLGSLPAGVTKFANGGGLSWGLYLSTTLATYLGGILGAWAGCKQFAPVAHLSPLQLA